MRNIAQYIHFFASPEEAERLFNQYLTLIQEQLDSALEAESYCKKIATYKEIDEREGFYAIAGEYQQLRDRLLESLHQIGRKQDE